MWNTVPLKQEKDEDPCVRRVVCAVVAAPVMFQHICERLEFATSFENVFAVGTTSKHWIAYSDAAEAWLQSHGDLLRLRTQLVPRHVSEGAFWAAFFAVYRTMLQPSSLGEVEAQVGAVNISTTTKAECESLGGLVDCDARGVQHVSTVTASSLLNSTHRMVGDVSATLLKASSATALMGLSHTLCQAVMSTAAVAAQRTLAALENVAGPMEVDDDLVPSSPIAVVDISSSTPNSTNNNHTHYCQSSLHSPDAVSGRMSKRERDEIASLSCSSSPSNDCGISMSPVRCNEAMQEENGSGGGRVELEEVEDLDVVEAAACGDAAAYINNGCSCAGCHLYRSDATARSIFSIVHSSWRSSRSATTCVLQSPTISEMFAQQY